MLFAALLAGAALSGSARAQSTPPGLPPAAAGAALNDPAAIGGGLIRRGEGEAGPQVGSDRPAPVTGAPAAAPPPAPLAGRVSFTLTEVRFGASKFIRQAELDALAAPLLGKRVGFDELNALLARINGLYAKRGVVTARAILPPQKIAGGVVRIDLVEGRVGAQSVVSPGYTPKAYVASRVQLPPGQVVDLDELRRRVSGFNRSNDVQLRAELQAGAVPGLTDIDYVVSDIPRTGFELFVDDNAYESTGRLEGGFSLRRNQLLVPGDRVSLYASASGGARTGVASYTLPIVGLYRGGFSYAHSEIAVVEGQFADAGVTGLSDTASLSLSRPILIGETFGVGVQGAFTWLRSTNAVAEVTTGDVIVKKGVGGLNGFTRLGRFGLLRGDASLAYGDVDTRVGQGIPHFVQATTSVDYTSPSFGGGFTVRAAAAGTYTDHTLPPGSQVFQIGGVSSVRGYEPGVASGFAGFTSNLELHYDFRLARKIRLDGYAFADAGEVHARVGGASTADSVGVGVNLQLPHGVLFQGVYAYDFEPLNSDRARDRLELRLALDFG